MRKNYERHLIAQNQKLHTVIKNVYLALEDNELTDGESIDRVYEIIDKYIPEFTRKQAERNRSK